MLEGRFIEDEVEEEEVREALFSSYVDGALGPYGLSFMFLPIFLGHNRI
jgi:hypothetical protein